MSGRGGLARRIVLAGVSGALVVSVVTVLLAVPLLRGVVRDQTHRDLVRAVDALASTPRLSARLVVSEQRAVGPDDRRYALVGAAGSATGDALEDVTPADLERLRSTGTLSTRHRVGGRTVLVEGRRVDQGPLAARGALVLAAQPTDDAGAATAALLRRTVLALLVGTAVAAALAVLIARRTTRPVRDAAQRAHRMAQGERGLLAPPPSGITEVDEMSASLTSLDVALAGSEGRQREFLLSVSHELRTPLTALRGYAEALRDGAVTGSEVESTGATLVRETERLDAFIADLLALARLEADDFHLAPVDLDPGEVVVELVSAWQARARLAGVRLRTERETTRLAHADPARLRQVLDGLVENALRVTADGGEIVVRVGEEPGVVVVEVVDDGPGLAPGEHEHAFERGYLHRRYAGARAVGTGLGLSIAARLSDRAGISLEAAPHPGGGTVFRLGLPVPDPSRRA